MKNRNKAFFAVLTTTVFALTLSACGGGKPQRKEGTLSILAYNGGYGIEWLEDICTEFESQTGYTVECDSDATILDKMESQLTDGSDYDIYMSHGISWQNYAARGLLADLDDVYDADINGKKFKDRCAANSAELSRYQKEGKEEHYYKVGFTQGVGGLVYNSDLFEQKGWQVPETYDELVTLCATIASDADGITPFAWAGSGTSRDYYWDYLIYSWWAEMDGLDKINEWLTFKGDDGKYASGYENFNPETKYKNFKKAYEMWYNLVAAHPEYSNDKAYGTTLTTAQQLFFNGKAAMIPYGQWAKHEIEVAMKKDFSFNVKMMRTPKVNKASDYYNFMVGFGDSMIVPQNSPNIKVAKEFLKFMASEYACKKFVEKSDGPFLAFDYSDYDMSDLSANNTYIASIDTILKDSKNFSTASNSPIPVINGETKVQPWFNNTRYYTKAMTDFAANDPTTVMNKLYDSAKSAWPSLCRTAEVK